MTGDLDRGATQLSWIKQGGGGRNPRYLRYYFFCNKLRNQRIAASQEKKRLPWTASCGKFQANVFKLERSVSDETLPPSGLLGEQLISHTVSPRLQQLLSFSGEITKSPKSCIRLKKMSCSGEAFSRWRKEGKVWRKRSPLKVMLKELGAEEVAPTEARKEGERESKRERNFFLPALLFYWPSPPGDWLHSLFPQPALRGFLSSVKKLHFLSRQILCCWVLKSALCPESSSDKHFNSFPMLPHLLPGSGKNMRVAIMHMDWYLCCFQCHGIFLT